MAAGLVSRRQQSPKPGEHAIARRPAPRALRDDPALWFDVESDPRPRSQHMLPAPSIRKLPTVTSPLAILLVVLVGGRIGAADGGGALRLATCQFPVSVDVKANGEWVRTQIRQA